MKLSVNIHVAKLTGYYGLGTVLLFNTFGFYSLPLGPKSFRVFGETGPWRGSVQGQVGGELRPTWRQ